MIDSHLNWEVYNCTFLLFYSLSCRAQSAHSEAKRNDNDNFTRVEEMNALFQRAGSVAYFLSINLFSEEREE